MTSYARRTSFAGTWAAPQIPLALLLLLAVLLRLQEQQQKPQACSQHPMQALRH